MHFNVYIWNIEKWYWWTYLQGRSRDINMCNRLVDTAQKGGKVKPLSHVRLFETPGSSVHGIFRARVLELVAISFSRGSSWPRDRTWVSSIADRCFAIWATREAHRKEKVGQIKRGALNRVLPYAKTAREKLPYSTGSSTPCSVTTEGSGDGAEGQKEGQEGGNIHILTANWFCCMAETNIVLQSNYLPIRNLKILKAILC